MIFNKVATLDLSASLDSKCTSAWNGVHLRNMSGKPDAALSHISHTPSVSGLRDTRALKIAGWLTGIYFLLELAVGLWTGSISVISDAFHTFSAVGGILIAVVAGHFAKRAATQFQTFGLIRAEIVGALFNGLFLFAMAILVLWMGIMRLQNPMDLPTGPMLLIAIGGLIIEIISIRLMWEGQKENLNMKGAFWHIIQTFVGSIIVIVSALVIRFTGFLPIDPILGMAFGIVLFWASWKIIREAFHILLDNVPRNLDLGAIRIAIEGISGVVNVHHLHAWALTSGKNVVSAHVKVIDAAVAARVQEEIYSKLTDDFEVYFSTVQVETHCFAEEVANEIDFPSKKE